MQRCPDLLPLPIPIHADAGGGNKHYVEADQKRSDYEVITKLKI
jgi:hypothetical protein